MQSPITIQDAFAQLDRIVDHPMHVFWPDSISLDHSSLLVRSAIRGHQQVTDAYLLSLAMKNGGKLATMDRGILSLLRDDPQQTAITVIS